MASFGNLASTVVGGNTYATPAIGSGVNFMQASSPSNSYTINTGTNMGAGAWLDQNFATPVLNTLGLGSLFGGSPISRQLDQIAPITGSGASSATSGGITGGSSQGKSSDFFTDLFLRSVIIILGFVFIATGLSMFKAGMK